MNIEQRTLNIESNTHQLCSFMSFEPAERNIEWYHQDFSAVNLVLTSTDKISIMCWHLGHRNARYARLVGIIKAFTQPEQRHFVKYLTRAFISRSIMNSKFIHEQKAASKWVGWMSNAQWSYECTNEWRSVLLNIIFKKPIFLKEKSSRNSDNA